MQKIEGLPHDPFPLLFLADIVVDKGDNVFICTSTQLLYNSLGEGHGGVYRSTDNAENWQKTGVVMTFAHALTTNSFGHIFTATRGFGAYRSTDSGASWTAISTGLKNVTVNAIVANSNGVVFAATHGAGVYRSADNGENWSSAWTQITGSVVVGYIKSLTINSQGHLFAGANIAGMYRSTDGGQSWQHLDPFQVGLGGVGVNALITNSQDYIFAGVNITGVFGSKDNGNSWVHLLDTLINVHMFALNSQEHVFAGSNSAGLFFSDDTGMTWTSVSIPSTVIISTMAFNAADELFAGFLSQFPNVAGIYRQSELGEPWIQVLGNFMPPPPFRGGNGIAINSSGIIFAGGSTGAAKSTDNGDSWVPYSEGLPNASFGHINADIYTLVFGPQDFLYAGIRNNGVYRSASPIVSLTPSGPASKPDDYVLNQNYPNPFNPSTTIRFTLPQSGRVRLSVFNILGQKVAEPINTQLSAGAHEIVWEAGRLPSGIYLYQLEFNGKSAMKKMVLLR
ncbi:MAG: T9SS type A sorting domain-containing protein [Gammaproteobacteria bacterium]|nr:T9SS type A sorting domain-containing protein [Gammaproteobacteria bacterium]NIW44265.1 T9SS type A sorting domain-containing protein [Gammaproteobacteria bacterium]NIX01539.1 T9SS type A sorting domain-containing protein [Phycisphaerae bacterium]